MLDNLVLRASREILEMFLSQSLDSDPRDP